jgi:hypothetical protein
MARLKSLPGASGRASSTRAESPTGATSAAETGQALLAGVILALAAGFVLTPFGADPSGRYFLPLAIPLALFAADLILALREKAGAWAFALVGLVLAYNAWGTAQCTLRYPPGLTTQFNAVTQVDTRASADLIAFLLEHGERRGYANYWVSYPLAFLSQEELIFTPRLPYHTDFRYTERTLCFYTIRKPRRSESLISPPITGSTSACGLRRG